jgi:hypothetical protein
MAMGFSMGGACGFIGIVICAEAADEKNTSEQIERPSERRNT